MDPPQRASSPKASSTSASPAKQPLLLPPLFTAQRARKRGARTMPRPAPLPAAWSAAPQPQPQPQSQHMLPAPMPAIPPTAFMLVRLPAADVSSGDATTETHFFQYDAVAAAQDGGGEAGDDSVLGSCLIRAQAMPPVLYIAALGGVAAVRASLGDVLWGNVECATEGASLAAVRRNDAHAWQEFEDLDGAGPTVCLLLCACCPTTTIAKMAHRLVASGFAVSGAACTPSARAPCVRAKGVLLHQVADDDVLPVLSRSRDAAEACASACATQPSPSCAPTPWASVLYGQGFQVHRTALNWGVFAARTIVAAARRSVSEQSLLDDLQGVEPLRSYVCACVAVTAARAEKRALPRPVSTVLRFNAAARLPVEDTDNAIRAFYWAAVHTDDETRPVSREAARSALEVYTTTGFVVLQKRAYEFHDELRRPVRCRVVAPVPPAGAGGGGAVTAGDDK